MKSFNASDVEEAKALKNAARRVTSRHLLGLSGVPTSVLVTTSKAPVTTSKALVPTSFLLLLVSFLCPRG